MSISEIMTLVNSNPTTPLNEGGVKIIKSIQRGSVTFTTTYSCTISISPVNIEKTIIRVSSYYFTTDDGVIKPIESEITYGRILSENSIVVGCSDWTSHHQCDWEVVEFY